MPHLAWDPENHVVSREIRRNSEPGIERHAYRVVDPPRKVLSRLVGYIVPRMLRLFYSSNDVHAYMVYNILRQTIIYPGFPHNEYHNDSRRAKTEKTEIEMKTP